MYINLFLLSSSTTFIILNVSSVVEKFIDYWLKVSNNLSKSFKLEIDLYNVVNFLEETFYIYQFYFFDLDSLV
ncbi:MAG: hypothetical protein WCI53_14160, partial [Bacteroidota bacterium]